MEKELIDKIKRYSVISFALPLIAINACVLVYKLLGTVDLYPDLDWNNKILEYSYKDFERITENTDSYSFTNCSEYYYDVEYITKDNKKFIELYDGSPLPNEISQAIKENNIKKIKFLFKNKKNNNCIKKYKFSNYILSNIKLIEEALIFAKKNNESGFAIVKNPYLYGEVSISRTARYYPASLVFKPLIILSAIFLILYWRSNLNLFENLKDKNVLANFSKNFFYLGIISCIFLILHALFLGVDFDTKLFQKIRKLIIILFIIFEVIAQISFTRNLYKFRSELNTYINSTVLKIKISFVTIILFFTSIVFILLVTDQLEANSKHVLEWNYFSLLLVFYFLSRILWKYK